MVQAAKEGQQATLNAILGNQSRTVKNKKLFSVGSKEQRP
jgi:hypothetical protein